jgi:tripartite-type tricarboxylate transporter receptor subunit TctC
MADGRNTMEFPRRRFLRLTAGAAALPAISSRARAEAYPTRPVTLVVTFPAGSSPDTIARLAAQYMSERLGQQVVVENRPGAGGNIATEYVAHAAPDGYTILMPVSSNAVNVALYRNLNFDFLRDIVPIAGIAKTAFIIVTASSFPAKNLKEFIAYLKANPGKVNMASGGIGTSPHLCGELFQILTGTKMTHVPYRANYMPDLLAGQVQTAFDPPAQALPLIRDGKLRAFGVTTAYRIKALPDVPAIGEIVKGYDAIGWYGLGAPAKTPPQIIKKLSEAMTAAIADPKVKERFEQVGVEPMPLSPEGFKKHIATEVAKWSKVIETRGIKIN